MLWHLWHDTRRRNPFMTHMFVVGDAQTFIRMIHMKQRDAFGYQWLIPFPGEFHFACHMIHAEYRLFWEALLRPIAAQLGKKKIKGEHTVAEFNRHEIFYLTVVQAAWEFMEGQFPEINTRPWDVVEECKEDVSLRTLCDFLLFGAAPYLTFRRLIRMPPSKERRVLLNKIIKLYAWRHRASHKTNYGPLCFHAMYVFESLSDELQDVWIQVYCVSIKGHAGRNVALDHLMEKVNKAAKQMLSGNATESRIAAIVPQINVVHRVETMYDDATSDYHFNPNDTGDGDLLPDVVQIKQYLRLMMTTRDTTQPGVSAFTLQEPPLAQRPWDVVANAQTDWAEYAANKCADFSWAAS